MKSKINITYRDANNEIIENPEEGQRGYSPETKHLYIYTNGEWQLISPTSNLSLTSYEVNQQIISQMENIETDEEAMQTGLNTIQSLRYKDNNYYMLLCRDINYYTLFHKNNNPMLDENDLGKFANEVVDCVHDIGAIKSIDETTDGAVEIWVQPVGEDPMAMYLFPYDQGVIECIL